MAERDFTDIRPERITSSYVEERSNVLKPGGLTKGRIGVPRERIA
jgi:hypothetical protein